MLKVYRKRLLIGLMVLLVVFALFFLFSIIDLNRGIPLIGMGIPYMVENYLIIILSVLGMIKSLHELIKVEHHQ
ncbi:hypothetical protein C4573_03005 [Candidatus Woesearchaeota archaeon]|nr:MAG: hypothetical protein C4573_03005 [Candidatus Woesearchaeota archaeon]